MSAGLRVKRILGQEGEYYPPMGYTWRHPLILLLQSLRRWLMIPLCPQSMKPLR
jgi:hypothetical protein